MSNLLPKHQRELGLNVRSSNLCAKITLPWRVEILTGVEDDRDSRPSLHLKG